MKRFMLFGGRIYYPSGGMNDFIGDFDTLEEAEKVGKNFIKNEKWTWIEVYDLIEKKIITTN